MTRLLRLGAFCAFAALSFTIGSPGVFAGQGQQDREAVATSPGIPAAVVSEETAAPPHAAQLVVQKTEVKLEAAAKTASPPTEAGGSAHATSMVLAAGLGHQAVAEVAFRLVS